MTSQVQQQPMGWSRYHSNNYEVSSYGDKEFSALNAKLKDGRTIEEAYQLDVKGYRSQGNDWRLGKGKLPLNNFTGEDLYREYKKLWIQWADENKGKLEALSQRAEGKVLTDQFATTPINQARVLAELINERVLNIKEESLNMFSDQIVDNTNQVETQTKPALKVRLAKDDHVIIKEVDPFLPKSAPLQFKVWTREEYDKYNKKSKQPKVAIFLGTKSEALLFKQGPDSIRDLVRTRQEVRKQLENPLHNTPVDELRIKFKALNESLNLRPYIPNQEASEVTSTNVKSHLTI